MTFTRRGIAITSLPHREQRFTPTPPLTGRPTRRPATSSDHTDGDLQRDPTEVGNDPDPPPEVNLPF
jgi:hypothetical protein